MTLIVACIVSVIVTVKKVEALTVCEVLLNTLAVTDVREVIEEDPETETVVEPHTDILNDTDPVVVILVEILDTALIVGALWLGVCVGALALGDLDETNDTDDKLVGEIVNFELAEAEVETVAVGVGMTIVISAVTPVATGPNCVA